MDMRKILSKEEKVKKETRNKVIIGLVLVAIMIFGTVGYAFFSNPTDNNKAKITYKGIEFILNENNLWQFKVQNLGFETQYNPKETENISVPVSASVYTYSGKPLFFLGQGAAKQEIARNLWNVLSRAPQDGCIKSYEKLCGDNTPIKNCSEDNIIIIQEQNYTEISEEDIEIKQEDNCIFIAAPYAEQGRAADAFLFKILGIN